MDRERILRLVARLQLWEWYRNVIFPHDGGTTQHSGALSVDTVYCPPESSLVLESWRS